MKIEPISLAAANAYVVANHRHHGACRGHKFSLAAVGNDGAVHGVAIVGRPVARRIDDGFTLEVNRLCTDGTRNACSMLYGAARRAAIAMGYRRMVTYTLESESGKSLKASGWTHVFTSRGGSWSVPSRPRSDKAPICAKHRWEVSLLQ